jgi:hypothetical protein
MWIITHVLAATLGLIAGFFVKSLTAYSEEKGKNLATKEDFNDLKEQTRELTHATKEIEAKIDDQVWNRQRQWEMKKEIFIEATRVVAKADETLARTISSYLNGLVTRDEIDRCEEYWYQLAAQASSIMVIADASTIEISSSMVKAFIDTVLSLNPNEDNRVKARQKFDQFRTLRAGFHVFTRKELGIEFGQLPTSQANESPATPTLGSQAPATDKPEHH